MGFRRLRPRFCSIYQPYYWRHERMWKLSRISFLPVFDGTPVKGLLWRLTGVRVGRRLFDDGALIPEKTLVTIGDHATLNAGTVIQCHSLEDASFKSDAVLIGNGATLGVNTFVHYGAELGDRVVLDADSFLMKGERPAPGARWRGNPAREIPEPAPDTAPLERARADTMPMAVVRPEPRPPGRLRAALAWAAVAGLGGLVLVRMVLGVAGAAATAGEQQLGSAVLTGPLTGWPGDLAARAQLTGYAYLTGAFERHPEPVGAARELALLAAVITVVALGALGRRLRIRPLAIGAGLGLLAAVGPAVLALGSFGPGQLGVMWLAVGGALLVSTGRPARTLGAAAVVVAVLTLPTLVIALAAAVVAATAARGVSRAGPTGPRELARAAAAAGLGAAAAVLLARLPATPTTLLDATGQFWLIAVTALLVAGGVALADRRQQATAVGAAVLLVLVGWRYPGADALLPGLTVSVALLGAALADRLGTVTRRT